MVAGLLAVCAPPAAADITIGPPQPVAGTTILSGIACGGPATCVAVGTAVLPAGATQQPGAVVPVNGGLPGPAEPVAGTAQLDGIACSDLSTCLAAGVTAPGGGLGFDPALVPLGNADPGAPQALSGSGDLFSVACPTDDNCIAAGESTVVIATDGSPGTPQTFAADEFVEGIACTDASTCFAAGLDADQGLIVPVTAGTPGTALPALTTVRALSAIACADATDCYAVGRDTAGDGVVVPITSGAEGAPQDVPGSTSLTGIACPTATECVAVGNLAGLGAAPAAAVVVPIDAGTAGAPQQMPGTSGALGAIACPTPTECLATGTVGPNGTVTQILVGPAPGPPSAMIGVPQTGASFPLEDQIQPAYNFTCQPAWASALASPGGCVATVGGATVTTGHPIDTSQAGTYTVTVTATGADGQQATTSSTYAVTKGGDLIYFPQLGPFRYHHPAVALQAIAVSDAPLTYSVLSGPCTVNGSSLSLIGWGTCVVMAEQPGTANYLSASATSTIVIDPTNLPTCAGTTVTVPSGDQATVALGCADADVDPGDALSLAVTSLPRHGTLTKLDTATGTVTYTPAPDYQGPDSFTFAATDAQGTSAPATIAIDLLTPPGSVERPMLTGTPTPGHRLRCSTGTWSGSPPLRYSYGWTRNGAVVRGRARATYAVGAGDVGRRVSCQVSATNAVGNAHARSRTVKIRRPPHRKRKRSHR
jgi:hypothetical protein